MKSVRTGRYRLARRVTILTTVPALAIGLLALQSSAVSGNIGSLAIEIDGNLYPGSGTDWVKDSTNNVGTGCLVDSIATCNQAGVTAATDGVGHWNGVRIVDGIGGNDNDIFLHGGKENDTSTWDVGAGTVGSSKYDATQAYLANNSTTLFFGMERRGNNGTTAFDFEFNQAAPANTTTYVPTRTNGDKLFTFEMSSSNGGSATPHIFTWTNGTSYVEGSTAGAVSAINTAPTNAGPWGYVDSKGKWVLGSLDTFEFAEASVDLATVFSGTFDPCSNAPYYTQVRTRSSSTPTSDLKDTTKIFEYSFTPGAAPTASKTSASAADLSATLTGTSDAGTTKLWQKTTSLAGTPTWSTTGVTTDTLTYSDFDTDVPVASAPVVAFSSGTSIPVTTTTNANGSYVGKVQTMYFRLQATKTAGSCVSYSTPVAVHKVDLIDP
jgi:hypothetical protein